MLWPLNMDKVELWGIKGHGLLPPLRRLTSRVSISPNYSGALRFISIAPVHELPPHSPVVLSSVQVQILHSDQSLNITCFHACFSSRN